MAAAKSKNKDKKVYVIVGSDDSAVRAKAAELASSMNPSGDALGLEAIAADAETVEEIVAAIHKVVGALQTVAFWERVVWMKNAVFLGDSVRVKSPIVSKSLERLIGVLKGSLPAGTKFLLSAPGADKRLSEVKSLMELGEVIECNLPSFGWEATEEAVVQWVKEEAKAKGLELTEEAAEVLAARVGTNPAQLRNELEKLMLCFREGEKLSAQTIRNFVSSTRQSGIFDLSNAILQRDLPQALSLTEQLLAQKETPIGLLLAAITPTFRNLLLVKSLMIKYKLSAPEKAFLFGKTLERLGNEATAHLPRKKDGTLNTYPLGIAAMAAKNFTLGELQRALPLCREANLKLMTTGYNPENVLIQLLTRTLAPSNLNAR